MTTGLPAAFRERLALLFDADELASVEQSFGAPRSVALRVNTLAGTIPAVRAELEAADLGLMPVSWCPEAFVLARGTLAQLQATPAYAEGRVYVQGLASMAVVAILDPRPGEDVLDMAAAPGSKTTQIAACMAGHGRLTANDRSRGRGYKLRAVLRAQHAPWVAVTTRPGQAFGRTHPEAYDRVLLDAPCSMEARIRSDDPASWRGWGPGRIRRLAGQQAALLSSAVRALRPGGTLVYSTCTFAPEENEAAVHRILSRFTGHLELLPIDLPLPRARPGLTAWRERGLDPSLVRSVRVVPDDTWEGFYIARLRKTASLGP